MPITGSAPASDCPPVDLLDGASLFLDFDGTLVGFRDVPGDVRADPELVELLAALRQRLDGRLAIVSGRSLAQLDTIVGKGARHLCLAGSHGCEFRIGGRDLAPERPESLAAAEAQFRTFAADRPGTLVEVKTLGTAIHFRQAPHHGPAALELADLVASQHGLHLQHGAMMAELRLGGGHKGSAIRHLMQQPAMAGGTPVFIGDDLTDEPGFVAAAELGGCGIIVGAREPTAARWRLEDSAAVRTWLGSIIR